MSERRTELTRAAARLFAERGYQGTSLADLAEALALRAHLAVVSGQLDISTVFVREWRYLSGERLERFVAERRRYEERIRELYTDGLERSELRADLDAGAAALLFLSAANWAYTWLRPGADTGAVADRLSAALLDGMRGYATPS
jgi:TetR/AcrR family transcriptional regulator, cholesterol catabolism regulator